MAGPRYTREEAADAIAVARSWADVLARLGMCKTGGSYRVLQKHAARWGLATDHLGTRTGAALRRFGEPIPLHAILVEGSTFSRGHLKRRLYDAGLKTPVCEHCGQGAQWRGRTMALILDHVNGVGDDNRIENLRILCPNCAATLETHCARNKRISREPRSCERCGTSFVPRARNQRYCSRECGSRWDRRRRPRPGARRVERPPHARLIREVRALGYRGTGRRYGVSDNAIRKWLRAYEREGAGETHRPGSASVIE